MTRACDRCEGHFIGAEIETDAVFGPLVGHGFLKLLRVLRYLARFK